ncbi:MAG TPA: sigma 54-interacting transcriptional regulator [Treponemataceae bacterium]|nr:sigma 54-interacting transcriptional regulator [Treponemataceae bacterium]
MSSVVPSVPIDVEKLNTLIEINSRINSSYTDVDALLVHILESAMRLVKCESSSILLVEDKDTLRFTVALGPKGIEAKTVPVKVDASIAGWVVKNNKPLIINDVPGDRRYMKDMQFKTGYKTYNMIAVPLRINNNPIGVVELLNKAEKFEFTQSDLEIIELLCGLASVAYQNADTYHQAQNEIQKLQKAVSLGQGYHEFIAKSPIVLDLLEVIKRVAKTNSSALILGESGVGKELFAEQIHLNSPRNDKPFIRVNCAALSEQLLESELFGHVKGAFTGAITDRKGRFETADGGTLFLDEIGELPLHLQGKLLRVIQEKTFERVGSSNTISVDVRIVAATNRNLEKMVQEKNFRSDLYFRLNVLPINIPPLRERQEDIIELANFFLQKTNREVKQKFLGFSDKAKDILLNYSWPGNVRELQNAIERACVFGVPPYIQVSDLLLKTTRVSNKDCLDGVLGDLGDNKELKTAIDQFKKVYLKKILGQTNWNQTKAAQILGIQRTYLSRLLKELDIRK